MADLLETPGEKQVRILGNSSPSFKSIPLSFTWLVHALVESDTRTEVCFLGTSDGVCPVLYVVFGFVEYISHH